MPDSMAKDLVVKLVLAAKLIKHIFFKPILPWFTSDYYLISKHGCSVFCGYYDLQPFKPCDPSQVLVHILDHKSSGNRLQLALYDSNSSTFSVFDESEAWNYQQGSRLHWLTDEIVIYNKLVDKAPVGVLFNVRSKTFAELPLPFNISDSSFNIYSLDFGHLARCSEYGYPNTKPSKFPLRVTKLLYESEYSIEKSISIDIPDLNLQASNVKRRHVNHLLPSPNHDFVVGIERYYVNGARFDNLVVLDFDKQSFRRVIEASLISHYCFLSHQCLLVWGKLQPYPQGYYQVYFTKSGQISHYKFLFSCQDGHPSAINSNSVITEVPQGKLLDDNLNLIIELSTRTAPPILYGLLPLVYPLNIAHRCDTHISLSRDKKFFEADFFSSHNRRSVVVFKRA